MINIPLIGLAAGLVLCALLAKVFKRGPEKSSKSDKAEIMKQLLAKSENEITIPAKKPMNGGRGLAGSQNKPAGRSGPQPQPVGAAIRSNK